MKKFNRYISAWHQRKEENQNRTIASAEKAQLIAKECAVTLHEDFSVRRVFLFGSLAEGFFKMNSDIDLVVEGLSNRDYFKALCKVHHIADGFDVDILPLEDYPYKNEVFKKGILFDDKRKKWRNYPPDFTH